MSWIIYKITSPSGKGYIGLTKRGVEQRWRNHCRDAERGSDLLLHISMRKYGFGNFKLEVLTECVDLREAKACERALISEHATFSTTGLGYNLTCGGDGNWGWKPSEETKAKIGAKSRERMAANPNLVKKMMAGWTGAPRPPRSAEHSAAIGRAHRGKKISQETRDKISVAGHARINSPETRAKISASNKGRIISFEAIQKMRASKLDAHAKRLRHEYIENFLRAKPNMTEDQWRKFMSLTLGKKVRWIKNLRPTLTFSEPEFLVDTRQLSLLETSNG